MTSSDWVTKERFLWDPRAWQLLRERTASRYARAAAPQIVDGVHICFPEIQVSFGLRAVASSRRIAGRSLLEMIYERETQGLALDMAMVALEALDIAVVSSNPFRVFGVAYDLVRQLKVAVSELCGESILSPEQRETLNRLVAGYTQSGGKSRRVLVHGDLHASNLLVNYGREERSLGFVDLEMLHVGKSATNFAQLWISFHFADVSLGRRFYRRYVSQFSNVWDGHFDADVRAEIALRSYALIRGAKKIGHTELARKAASLLGRVLDSREFVESLLSSESLKGNEQFKE